ncbi:MAG: hypothetical protein LUO82_01685 [Methanomicrobiales archaeon]|nr:hypothetical protein [Methanomicrobiales archaeon]
MDLGEPMSDILQLITIDEKKDLLSMVCSYPHRGIAFDTSHRYWSFIKGIGMVRNSRSRRGVAGK